MLSVGFSHIFVILIENWCSHGWRLAVVDPRGGGHPMFCQTYKPPLKNAGLAPVAPSSLQITDHRNSGLDHKFVGHFFHYIFTIFFSIRQRGDGLV